MKVESTHEPQTVLGDAASSVAPDGSVYPVPSADEARSSFESIAESAREHRSRGGRVVVVQGLGFVGSAAAAVIADATDHAGRYPYFVIGVDLATPPSYWKVARVAAGTPPVASADPKLAHLTASAVHEVGNLRATTCEDAYSLADVILVDVQLDARSARTETTKRSVSRWSRSWRRSARSDREWPEALVLVETTVPVGTCERVVLPVLREERLARGVEEPVFLAHAYERVMPGPRYVESIRAYPRTFAGVDERSSRAAREFLSSIIRTPGGDGPELDTPASSELAKLLENSYRATNIAFIHETLLAEDIGVNLFEVVDSIRVRKGTHDNMRYLLRAWVATASRSDLLLAQWGATQLLERGDAGDDEIGALATNEAMPSTPRAS